MMLMKRDCFGEGEIDRAVVSRNNEVLSEFIQSNYVSTKLFSLLRKLHCRVFTQES